MIDAAARGEGPKRRAKAAQFAVGMLDREFAAPLCPRFEKIEQGHRLTGC
jgi:hypothetical protein